MREKPQVNDDRENAYLRDSGYQNYRLRGSPLIDIRGSKMKGNHGQLEKQGYQYQSIDDLRKRGILRSDEIIQIEP